MILVCSSTINYKTLRHDFDNEWAYLEKFENDRCVRSYFARKDNLFPDGSLKSKLGEYFYIPFVKDKSELENVDWTVLNKNRLGEDLDGFKQFDKLFCFWDYLLQREEQGE